MYALIMAGGRATRLGNGEKAITRIRDRALLDYILDAVQGADINPIVITSLYTPYTSNYCRGQAIEWLCTSGKGYIEDLCEAVILLDLKEPLFTICADLPGITSEHILQVKNRYYESSCDALSVWVPISVFNLNGQSIPDNEWRNNSDEIPVGLNIIRGDLIEKEQIEERLIINDSRLALNINTRHDLDIAEKILENFK